MGDLEPAVRIERACVAYGDVRAVDDVSLTVTRGAVHVLLGRSGSGKTTLLRAIAGFETLRAGAIEIGGRLVDDGTRAGWVAPEDRRIGFVFQDYALFTHLDARDNIAFGAPQKTASERRAHASSWLERVQLGDHAARRPGELSGGEQQRVALARALAHDPAIVLLDEPFSNLDPDLRRRVRHDTVSLIRDNGATAIFVTHDVEEAFTIGDTLSVLERGRLAQTGSPRALYAEPASRHVAQLCGPVSFLPIESVAAGRVRCVCGEVEATGALEPGALLAVRPEHVVVGPGGDWEVRRSRYLGPATELEIAIGEHVLTARVPPGDEVPARVSVQLSGPIAAIRP